MGGCVALDPMDARRRHEYAEILVAVGRSEEALAQLDRAREINAALLAFGERFPPPSTARFSPGELLTLELLRARARAAREGG